VKLHIGLRLQIIAALAGLMSLSFGPLFFAVASLTNATIWEAREQTGRALARSIAAHLDDALSRGGHESLQRALHDHVVNGDVDAVCVFSVDGQRLACEGPLPEPGAGLGALTQRSLHTVRAEPARALEVIAPLDEGYAVARLRVDRDADRGAPLVRLVALYMGVFAFALIVFAYFAITHLIVRPVDDLVAATDRVANGSRILRVPRRGASELLELGASVQSMTEKLIAEESNLRQKIDELTEAKKNLEQAQAQLVRSERMASVGRLAAGLAHEIGNPLAALIGMQDLLLGGDLSEETKRDFIGRMRRETDRIHMVVRDLLDFARPEGAGTSASTASQPPADVRTVVENVFSLVRPQEAFRGIRLESHLHASLRIALPAPRLVQVLLNLLLNAGAALASAAGAQAVEPRVVLRAVDTDDGRVRIEVEDNGPGIARGIRERLFEPFATTKDVGEGTGLGLAVCRGIVESAGGEIGWDASYEEGARFYVIVPSVAGLDQRHLAR
jgi:signal transduction histidine kinase